ncbi:MAG: FecR family protein [Pirellulales bacterium]
METFDHKLFRRVHGLAVRQVESTLTDAEHAELETLLLESGAARRLYVEYSQETACLRWMCLEEYAGTDRATPAGAPVAIADRPRIGRRRVVAILAALACSVLVVIAANWMPRSNQAEKIAQAAPGVDALAPIAESVATVTGLKSAHWLEAAEEGRLLARCRIGERWQLDAGQAELTFDSGVLVTLFAPADFDILSPTSIRCRRGRVTALVNERGKGFTVETPQGKVVDLGTQFGLDIADDGETEVVVFQGSVDLAPEMGEIRRMEQGDAMLLKNSGEVQRLVSLRRDNYLGGGDRDPSYSPLIADVRDNIRQNQSLKSYQIVYGGMNEDALCFVDRDHEWNGIDEAGLPKFLLGADYIMPFNDDKFVEDLELSVELSRPAMLYIFIDNNMQVPDWLREQFEDTGVDIGLDGAKTEWHPANSLGVGAGQSVDFPFSVWRRAVREPGVVKLGGLTPPAIGSRSLGFNMYGIAAADLGRDAEVAVP